MIARSSEREFLQRGRELLEAQRRALVSGDLESLDRLTRELGDWLKRPASLGADGAAGCALEAASLRAELAVNATVATHAASNATRALDTLLAGSARTYGADGRSLTPSTRRAAFSA